MERSLDMDAGIGSFYTTREDRDQALLVFLHKEASYLPGDVYVEHLQSLDLAQTQCRLNLSIGSVFDAVNYLDRYISVNRFMKWKYWMVELLSVACLSIASKCNEVSIPPLLQFQVCDYYYIAFLAGCYYNSSFYISLMILFHSSLLLSLLLKFEFLLSLKKKNDAVAAVVLNFCFMEDLDHSFLPDAIQRMEITVLKALGWRLTCVTAYSYVDLMTWHLHSLPRHIHVALTERMTELLLGALSDPKFIEFRPSTVAASALRCGLEELLPSKLDTHLSDLASLLPHDRTDEMDKCHKIMEERVVDPQYSLLTMGPTYGLSSPVSVMAPERIDGYDYFVDFTLINVTNPKKRKREDMAGLMMDDHSPILQSPVHE
ncbi:putative cyclin-D7-1 [Magnolia sinica]|uniref:putative cyclin-D7-1 n=1 Tax=Magnolia sinica TaxID=86752 RepID=UPI00265A6B43|nr:putative cyclin-D7-1 [Magnolia sinica]